MSLSSHQAAGRFCRRSSGAKRAETSASVRSRAELVAPANSASASAALPVGPLPKPVAPCERDKDGGSANLCSRRTDLTCSTVSLVCDCHCRRRREVTPTYSSPRPGSELSVSHTYRGNAHSDFGAGADTEQPCSATPSSMPVLVWASVGLGQRWFGGRWAGARSSNQLGPGAHVGRRSSNAVLRDPAWALSSAASGSPQWTNVIGF